MRIVQLTSVHHSRDVRVFHKMCASVVAAGHEVHLVVPTGKPETQIVDGVIVHGLSLPSNRIERIYRTVSQVLNVAAELQGDLYQFHDPEFLRVSVDFQQKTGAPVVYDSHEDYRLQMLYKSWLPRWSRRLVAASVGRIEDRAVCKLAGVIAATPSIAERFGDHPACVVIQNFPITANTNVSGAEFENRVVGRFGYVGSLSIVRGAKEMIDAIAEAGPDVSLELGGAWQPAELREVCVARRGWRQVIERGYLERDEVYSMFGRVFAGLTLLHPVESYLTAYSTKMFEYMSVGLPVIASDFPLWRRIVEDADCGVLADPLDPHSVAQAMRYLVDNPDIARSMGESGLHAIEEKYNWECEKEKLLAFYERLTGITSKYQQAC